MQVLYVMHGCACAVICLGFIDNDANDDAMHSFKLNVQTYHTACVTKKKKKNLLALLWHSHHRNNNYCQGLTTN